MTSRFMSLKEVAELLDVSERTVRREVEAGRLIAFKVGHSLRFESSEVEDYIKRQQVPPEHEKAV